jgi:hypothetical protein
MRFRLPEIFLGIFLTVAVFSMGMLFGSSRGSPPKQQTTSDAAQENANHPPDGGFWDWVTHDAAGFFTLWLVIVGGGQIGLFYWQLQLIRISADDAKRAGMAAERAADATAASVDLARDTAKRQLRAYVTVNGIIRTKDPGDLEGAGFAVLVDIKNNGQTPAFDLLQWAQIEIKEFPLETLLPIHCLQNPTRGILPPETKSVAFPVFTRALTNFEENAIRANHTAIYVYGEVDYLDVFGDRHFTRFRLRCNGQGFPLGMFKPDGEGNEAT